MNEIETVSSTFLEEGDIIVREGDQWAITEIIVSPDYQQDFSCQFVLLSSHGETDSIIMTEGTQVQAIITEGM